MINVVTPFNREQNLELLSKVLLKAGVQWTVLVDREIDFPEWVEVKRYDKAPAGVCPSNWLFNKFIDEGLDDETQYMILCDDDSIEDGFFDDLPNSGIVITSMKRGERVPPVGCGYGHGDLLASPLNIGIGKIGGEQFIVKGKILKNYRYGLSSVGDGEMIVEIMKTHTAKYRPDKFVLFNYFEDGRYDSFRRNPLVLFIGDFWCAGHPKMGKSEWETNIYTSLASTNLADVVTFHFDKYFYHTGKRGDEAVLKAIEQLKPDYVVCIIYKQPASDPTVIALETLMAIDVPIITIWGDLEAEEQRHLAKAIEPICWKMIGTANKEVVEGMGYTYMHVPKDPKIFNNPNKTRDIDVVFSGSYGYGREERTAVLQHLLDKGIKLVVGGSEGGDHFTTEEYADRYKRAKVAISFSQARGMNVVNARPFEILSCGALLLEQKSPELAKLYDEGKDYDVWTTKEDLYNKICYYLEHEEERLSIANSGCNKTQQLYSAETFWSNVLKK